MRKKKVLDRIEKYIYPFRVTDTGRLSTQGLRPRRHVRPQTGQGEAARIAQSRHGVASRKSRTCSTPRIGASLLLLVFQAMDAAGKDGAIKHVMSGINPQGCQVSSFKQPSPEDLDHDFLALRQAPSRARAYRHLQPLLLRRGARRARPEILEKQKLPLSCTGKRIWNERLADIAHFEDYLTRQGTIILKFFLHLSRKEQKKRFLERLDRPEKHWKFSSADIHERALLEGLRAGVEERRPLRGSMRHGTLCRPTTSGLPGLSSPPLLWTPWITSNSVTRSSTQLRRRNS